MSIKITGYDARGRRKYKYDVSEKNPEGETMRIQRRGYVSAENCQRAADHISKAIQNGDFTDCGIDQNSNRKREKVEMKTLNKIESKIMLVTPQMAKEWLATNTHNRPINKINVGKFAEMMRCGKWSLIGDAIQFDNNGVLVNGQHRLTAVIESGESVTFLVMWGMDESAWIVEGNGKPKTPSDVLCRIDVTAPNSVAAAMRGIISIVMNASGGYGAWLTHRLAYELGIRHGDEIQHWTSIAKSACDTGGVRYFAIYGSMLFMIAKAHGEQIANKFADSFFRGLNLKPRTRMFSQRTAVVVRGYEKGTKKNVGMGQAKFYIYGMIRAFLGVDSMVEIVKEHERLCRALPATTRRMIEDEATSASRFYKTGHATPTIKE